MTPVHDDNDMVNHQEEQRNIIRSVRQSVNGDNFTLKYPIVTHPSGDNIHQSSNSRPRHSQESWTMTLKRKTKKFLGLEEDGDEDRETLWRVRRIRLANR